MQLMISARITNHSTSSVISFNRCQNNMGKDISVFTHLLASVQRFHPVLNNPGIKPTLIQGCTISHQKNVGAASFLTSFRFLSVVFWGLLERSITESAIKKNFKKQHIKQTNKKYTVEKHFRKKPVYKYGHWEHYKRLHCAAGERSQWSAIARANWAHKAVV